MGKSAQAAGSGGETGAIYVGGIVDIVVDNPADEWSSGSITLEGGHKVIVPANLLVDLPANRMTLQQFCFGPDVPAAEQGNDPATGLSNCGIDHVAAMLTNRQGDGRIIAGDVFIHKDEQEHQGIVTSINTQEGWFMINDQLKVRINDPEAVHSLQMGAGCPAPVLSKNCSPDARYTNDPTNYTMVGSTGYPICVNGPNCSTNSGRPTGATAAQVADANRFEPLQVGDHVSTTGNMEVDSLGNMFQSAHSMLVGVQLSTAPGQADYIVVDEAEWDVNTWANLRLKGLNIGMMTSDTNVGIYRVAVNGASDATPSGSCETPQLIGHSAACNALGGGCTANLAANPVGGLGNGQVMKLNYDFDFVVGESKPHKNPASILGASGDPHGILVAGDTDANNSFRVFAPVMREIIYKTATFEACEAGTGPCFDVRDANGNPAQWGFYLSPNGIGYPEFGEISLRLFDHPFVFEGLSWNNDRRLGPGGGNEPLASFQLHDPAMALNPFPTSGIDSCNVIDDMLANANTGFVPTICSREFLIHDACAGAAPAPAPVGDTTPPVVTPEADVILDSAGPFPVAIHLGSPTVTDNVSAPANITLVNNVPSGNFDVGVTLVTWTATDEAGNSGSNTQLVIVNNTNPPGIDTNRPVITLNGDALVTITKGDAYADAGATALDDVDGDITANINTDNPVNTNVAGTYTVKYNVVDSSANPAIEVRRTVVVDEDITPPVITMLGDNPATVNLGDAYADAGATVSDNSDPNPNLTTDSTVNTAVAGNYTVTYNASDASGNTSLAVRTVNVVDPGPAPDTTPPVITRVGDAVVNITVGGTYTDAGATASDNVDGNLTGSIVTVNPVNTAVVDSYTVTYDVSDAAGNPAAQITRTVNVNPVPADTTPPVITRLGNAEVNLTLGQTYTDAGATASDNVDGDITGSIITVNPVNTAVAASYTVTYDVSDAAGNPAAQVTRTVNVVDPTPPPSAEVCSLSRALYIGGTLRDFWSFSGISDTLQGQSFTAYLGPEGDTSRTIGSGTVSSTGRISLTTPRGSASVDGTVPQNGDSQAWIETGLGCRASASITQIGN